jgi:hypothetical protein
MGIPDNTYFGEKPEGGTILYGEVRTIKDEQKKLELLKSRIDTLLIKQIDELGRKDVKGVLIIWSPFPLAVLILLAIETLGRIINDIEKIKEENEYEQSKIIVTSIYRLIDLKLSYKPTKTFYKNFEKIHGTTDKKAINRYSDVIHKYQRNTFNHGYQAKGVYLSADIKEPWIIKENEGFLGINPYLFWEEYKRMYNLVFEKILKNEEKKWRINAIKYFENLLK